MSQPKVASDLHRQVEAESDDVGALFTLREPSKNRSDIERIVKRMMERATKRSGLEPEKILVYDALGAFLVRAHARLVRELLTQSEIKTATSVGHHKSAQIEPGEDRDPEPGEGEVPYKAR